MHKTIIQLISFSRSARPVPLPPLTFAFGLAVLESGADDREPRAFHDPRLRSITITTTATSTTDCRFEA